MGEKAVFQAESKEIFFVSLLVWTLRDLWKQCRSLKLQIEMKSALAARLWIPRLYSRQL